MKLKILVLMLLVSSASAVELKRAVIDCGGGKLSSDNMSMIASLGQPVTGIATNNTLTLYSGWLWFVQSLTSVSEKSEVMEFSLLPSKNVTTGGMMIKFTMPKENTVKLLIFDATGRVVHREIRYFRSGKNQFVWNSPSPSGIYFFQLKMGEKTLKGKILKIKR